MLSKTNNIGWGNKRHLLSIDDFSRKEIETILEVAKKLEPYSNEGNELSICRGFILKPVFFEPSSRTLDSFTSAMSIMGGSVQPPHLSITSSMEKGESEIDTVVTYAQFSDLLVIRHPQPHSVDKFAEVIDSLENRARIINAGDGHNEHPTQALFDLYTIFQQFKTLDNLTLIVLGDLKYGRTVHSLILGIRKFENTRIMGFPVSNLKLPDNLRNKDYSEFRMNELHNQIKNLSQDSKVVIYATRVQWERMARKIHKELDKLDSAAKQRIREEIVSQFKYKINKSLLDTTPPQTILLHPLPKGEEIEDDLFYSNNSKLMPIKQMRNALQVRMAILGLFCGQEEKVMQPEKYVIVSNSF